MKCENCGAEITDKMKFCSECGTHVPTDKECPACHTRCALAAKFCSECGHDFSKPVVIEEDTDDDADSVDANASSAGQSLNIIENGNSDTDENGSEEKDSSSGGNSRKSRTCAVFLKDVGSDKNAVIMELRTLLNKTFGEAKGLVEQKISPKPLHLDCPREKAEEIAAALEAVGATVEIADKDIGTVTSGNCAVVIKKLPFMMGRGDRMGVACVIAEAEGCMPANAWKMLDNLPLTFAKNISREEAEEIASKIEARKCTVEIVEHSAAPAHVGVQTNARKETEMATKKTTTSKPAAKKPADANVDDTHEKVQLWEGGPYWATTNIGADKPEDFGYYFWWGDTIGYKREKDKWVATDGSSDDFSFNVGNTPESLAALFDEDAKDSLLDDGVVTDDGVLTPEHDAAHIHWGGDWRMPTEQELDDLLYKCDWTLATINGIQGYVVNGKGAYASSSIFLPCAGFCEETSVCHAGSDCYYWSSVSNLDDGDGCNACYLTFSSRVPLHEANYCPRYLGYSVRPVQGFTK